MYNYTESISTFFLYKEIETVEPTRPAFKAKFVISSRLRVRLESKVGDAKRMLSPTVDQVTKLLDVSFLVVLLQFRSLFKCDSISFFRQNWPNDSFFLFYKF